MSEYRGLILMGVLLLVFVSINRCALMQGVDGPDSVLLSNREIDK